MTRTFNNYTQVGGNITIIYSDGTTKLVTPEHGRYLSVKDALQDGLYEEAATLADEERAFQEHYDGTSVQIINGQVYLAGKVVENSGTEYLLQQYEAGFTHNPGLAAFITKLEDNPSYRVREQLFKFLIAGGNALTEDGDFLAYKKVRDDYRDIYTGTMDNTPGNVVQMDRAQVDDEPDRTCSAGLHVCSRAYLEHYGSQWSSRVVSVKVNPADVVAIPSDYNDTKMRVSRYEVLADITQEYKSDPLRQEMPVEEQKGRDTDYVLFDLDEAVFDADINEGSVGRVVSIDSRSRELVVRFDVGDVTYTFDQAWQQLSF